MAISFNSALLFRRTISSSVLIMRINRKISEQSLNEQPFNFPLIFKSSYDKANRSSVNGFRGPGLDEGLKILQKVRNNLEIPVLTDVHDVGQASAAAEVVDVIQIPAFLCRQTDMLTAAGKTGKPVNIKKGQFMAPQDMEQAARKVDSGGGGGVMITDNKRYYQRAMIPGHHEVRMRSELTYKDLKPFAVSGGYWKYRASPVGMAIAAEQLKRLDELNAARQANFDRLRKRLNKNVPFIRWPRLAKGSRPTASGTHSAEYPHASTLRANSAASAAAKESSHVHTPS